MDNPLTAPAFAQQFIGVGNIENQVPDLPGAPQPGTATTINTNDRRAQNAVWVNNRLWTCAVILPASGADSGQATAHWWETNTTTLSAISVVQQGNIGGEALSTGTHTFFPSIAVNSLGDACIGFAASSTTLFAGAYAAVHLSTDSAGVTGSPLTIAAGVDYYVRTFGSGRNRWGDYSGTNLDPADNLSFWVFNEYAITRGTVLGGEDGRWGTRWGHVLVDSVAPVITLPGPVISYTENDSATILDATATVTDSDSANFNSGTLTVDFSANGASEDRLGIRNEGTGAGQIGVSGSTVTYGGTTIGTFSGGTSGSSPLVVTFTTTSATPAAAQALVRNITYQNVSDNPSTLARTVRCVITDGLGGTSAAVTKTVSVAAVNDAPTLTAISDPAAILEDAAAQTVNLAGISAGGGESQSLTVTATSGNIALIPDPTVTYTSPNATGSLNYTPVANASGTAVITVVVNDGQSSNNTITRTFTVAVTEVNDAPAFPGYAVGTKTGTSISIARSKILAKASDLEGDTFSVTSVGTPSQAGSSAGLSTNTLDYTPPASFAGTDTVPVTITDSRGGAVTANLTVTIVADTALSNNAASMQMVGGTVVLVFYGIPGRSYQIQRSSDLTTWSVVQTVSADASGRISWTDPGPIPSPAFYRTHTP